MDIFSLFKKDDAFTAGLYIDTDGDFQLVELVKRNTSYFPVFIHTSVLENFARDGIFRKKSFIEKFKKLREEIQANTIHINAFENKKLENEIHSALKISGFDHITVVSEPNIYGIILPARSDFQQMSVYFSGTNITFTTTEHGHITDTKTIPTGQFSVSTAANITKHLNQKHIFLSGIQPTMLDAVTGVFYQAGIKVHLHNIWENFLNLADGIPSLFPEESQKFIDVLSITVPGMKHWEHAPQAEAETAPTENQTTEQEPQEKESPKTTYLPKPKKHKRIGKKSAKKIHKLETKKTEVSAKSPVAEKKHQELDYDLKKEDKTFLPKKIKKMFLPKPKKSSMWKKVKKVLTSEI